MSAKQLLPEAEYQSSLPKKRMGVGVLFFNSKNELLIVKPNYRDGWSVPGGVIDENESPREGAIRETREEIGLDVPQMEFLILEYGQQQGEKSEGLEFMFYGGRLSEEKVNQIILSAEEFDEWKFASIEESLALLRPSIKRRVDKALEVLKTNVPVYSEFPGE